MFFCVGCRMLTVGGNCMKRNLSRTCFPFGGWGMDSTKCDPSHKLMQVELYPHIYWCRVCGAISSKQAKLLLSPCRGSPTKWGDMYSPVCMGDIYQKTIFQPDKVWVGGPCTSCVYRHLFGGFLEGDSWESTVCPRLGRIRTSLW